MVFSGWSRLTYSHSAASDGRHYTTLRADCVSDLDVWTASKCWNPEAGGCLTCRPPNRDGEPVVGDAARQSPFAAGASKPWGATSSADVDEWGRPRQSSEATVGPYALQDFALFHVLRYGFRPSKIAFLAWHAWRDPDAGAWPPGFPTDDRFGYTLAEIRRWLEVFVHRFFAFSQFKRSALPNGPKVSAGGSLSPRGDWRAC